MSVPLLEVNDLTKHFSIRSGLFGAGRARVYAVDGVSFTIDKGETLALVGESGCGKSTVGKAILRLFDITSGQVVLGGQRIDETFPLVAKVQNFLLNGLHHGRRITLEETPAQLRRLCRSPL